MDKKELTIAEALEELNKIDDDEVFEEKKEIKEEWITEASINRVYSHLEKKEPFALISACRGATPDKGKEFPTKEQNEKQDKINKENTRKLENHIKMRLTDFGYNKITGTYTETYTCTDENGKDEIKKRDVEEHSFIVYSTLCNDVGEDLVLSFAKVFGRTYNQDTILFFDSEGRGTFVKTRYIDLKKPYVAFTEEGDIPYGDEEKELYALKSFSPTKNNNSSSIKGKDFHFKDTPMKRETEEEERDRAAANKEAFFSREKEILDAIKNVNKDKKYKSLVIEEAVEPIEEEVNPYFRTYNKHFVGGRIK